MIIFVVDIHDYWTYGKERQVTLPFSVGEIYIFSFIHRPIPFYPSSCLCAATASVVVVFGGLPPLTLPLPLPLPSGTIARFTGLGCHSEGVEYISSPRCGCRHCETLLSVIYHCHLLPMVTEYLRSVFLSRHHGRCCWPLPLPLPSS